MSKSNKKVKEVEVQVVETSTKIDTSKYDGLPSKSSKIRSMFADGLTRSQIANLLGIRYQHVRNVLITPLKKGE